MNRRTLTTLFLITCTGIASAQESESPSPLSGPPVREDAQQPRVKRDFEGNMKPLGVRPEIAALDELTLSPEERARVDEVLAKRSALLSRLIRENIDLLLRAQAVREGNDPEARRVLMQDFREAFKELSADGTLSEQITAALSKDNAAAFDEINREYWRELVKASSGDEPGARPGRAALQRAALNVLRNEIKQSYERTIAEGRQRIDEVVAHLELTPEQEAKVRAIVTEFGQKTKLNPTGTQRIGLFAQIAKELTREQRLKAFDLVRDR